MQDASLEFVGTATSLLRLGPFTLLTDPNFLHEGQRAYLGKGLFSRRRTEPSLQPAQLPALDAVVLSHLHGDHFDRVARRDLDRSLPILTTPAASNRLRDWGFGEAVPMTPWSSRTLTAGAATLHITSAPGEHAPRFARALMPPVMGSVVELDAGDGTAALRVYLTGDTLYRPWLREVVDRCGPIDAMVIHLGGTRALGILVTMDAAQGADLVDLIAPRVTVPVHYDDYTVFRSPLADFVTAWGRRGLPGDLRTVGRGEQVSLRP
ncbi:MBL fold metallo-hydrolase [Nocardioides sp. BP30]|uniref:MBL fold metallo-hydrolase n=1 Tax=Nocardioides sp. BP30 TaxID=3036374 RepID=UPI0024698F3A|nr:MBL fold metallo-hydrolase [Nocardioides sp. BP30]WGL50747.1 MBL fold metallo-hydrolase [Nocardioides sp. BP30]